MTLVSFTKKDIKNLCPDKPKIEMTNKLIEEIMEDMLQRAKQIDNKGLCLGLFTIQEILTKHLSNK